MKTAIKIAFILMIVFVLSACGKKGGGSNGPKTWCMTGSGVAGDLYAFGDSISAGLDHPSYPELVACEQGYRLLQRSKGGTPLVSAEQRDQILATNFTAADTVFFAPGVNDAILNAADPAYIAQYTQGLRDILNHLRASGARVYIGTPARIANDAYSLVRFGGNANIDLYAQINRDEVAALADPQITLVDYNTLFTVTMGNTMDGLHPNAGGYREMANVFYSQR